MLLCKNCGNYLNFHTSAYVVLENIIGKHEKGYEVSVEEEIQETNEPICTECEGKDSVVDVDINLLSKDLQTELYDKICNCVYDKKVSEKVIKEVN